MRRLARGRDALCGLSLLRPCWEKPAAGRAAPGLASPCGARGLDGWKQALVLAGGSLHRNPPSPRGRQIHALAFSYCVCWGRFASSARGSLSQGISLPSSPAFSLPTADCTNPERCPEDQPRAPPGARLHTEQTVSERPGLPRDPSIGARSLRGLHPCPACSALGAFGDSGRSLAVRKGSPTDHAAPGAPRPSITVLKQPKKWGATHPWGLEMVGLAWGLPGSSPGARSCPSVCLSVQQLLTRTLCKAIDS